MIEFTLSRVAIAVCGVILMAAVTGFMGGLGDVESDGMDRELAWGIAGMLDSFDESGAENLFLRGEDVLPSKDHRLSVGGNVVVLAFKDKEYRARTSWDGTFELSYGGTAEISSSESGDHPARVRSAVIFKTC